MATIFVLINSQLSFISEKLQQFNQMLRKTKKERPTLDFKTVDSQLQSRDIFSNNSSSIIQVHQQEQENSMQHLNPNISTVQPSPIRVKPPKTLILEEYQQEVEQKQQDYQTTGFSIVCRKNENPKEEEDINEKKQTVATNNQSGRSQGIKHMRNIEQRKQLTQHYSYDEQSEENSDQQNDNQQDNQQEFVEQSNKKVLKVEKQFVAQTLDDLIFAPIPSNCSVTCAVNYNHQILSMTRKYNLYLVKQKKYLLSAVKQRLKLTSQFQLKDMKIKDSPPIGYLKSNFTGLQYIVNKVHRNQGNRISEQCWIGYDSNLLGLTPQRNITILKNVNAKLEKIPFFSQIKNYYENGVTSKFQKFVSKRAVLNNKGEFELDFHGKVSDPSIKNFILSDSKDRECIVFGKRKNNTFILEIGHPFSIFEGFAIAVSSLDHKLCVR